MKHLRQNFTIFTFLLMATIFAFSSCQNDVATDDGGLSVTEAATYILSMTESGTVKVSDSVNGSSCWDIPNALKELYKTHPSVRVTLDLSGMNNLTFLPIWFFGEVYSLKSVILPDSLATINRQAFYGCKNLETVEIPDTCTAIRKGAFQNCTSLSEITLPSHNVCLEEETFYNCKNLTTVNILDISDISTNAFLNCTSLSEIVLPEGVAEIWPGAFEGCTALSKVTFAHPSDYYIRLHSESKAEIDVTNPATNAINLKDSNGEWFYETISRNWD